MKKTLLGLGMALFTLAGTAQQQDKFKKIDSLLTFLTEKNKFMGAVSLSENGKTVFEKAYGYADVANNIKATPTTKYKIGSITKMFTATAIFKLVEDKKLTLDTKLSKFYPKVKNADKITIDNLLSHSTGIFNFTNAEDFMGYALTPQTKEQMVKRIEGFESVFEPGSQNEYSNSNYLLLGYIIETITKKKYADAINDMVIKKAGLKNTSLFNTVDPKANEAYSYVIAATPVKVDEWSVGAAYSAGALQATMTDLDTFIYALFSGKIISKESVALMTTMTNEMGRGIFPMGFYERPFVGHSGHIENFSSVLGYNPKDGVAIALVTNGGSYDLNDVLIGVMSNYYGTPYKFPEFSNIAVDAKILEGYMGNYTSADLPLDITIMYENGQLFAQATGQDALPLEAESDTEFTFKSADINITFKPNAFSLEQHGATYGYTRK
ncbi:MAG: serine hydrolase domain-containing protein [Bacteroidota bacterium]